MAEDGIETDFESSDVSWDDEYCLYHFNTTRCSQEPPGFTKEHLVKVVILLSMVVISTVGNGAAVLVSLHLRRRRKSTVTTLVLNLSLADLMVTYLHMLPQAIWYCTVQWMAGNIMCKVMKFFSSFGLFASSFLTVDISVDRCLAVVNPLGKSNRGMHMRILIGLGYVFAAIFSIPQVILFWTERGPFDENFFQCVGDSNELKMGIYTTIVIIIQFVVPLILMVLAYALILYKITTSIGQGTSDNLSEARSRLFLRAQQRTIRMAAAIFAVFVINWAPYSVASLWYMWVPGDHQENHILFEICFLFGLSNSCFNPLIYGACNIQHVNYLLRFCGIKIGDDANSTQGSDRKTSTYYVRGNQTTKTSFAPRSGVRGENYNNHHAGGGKFIPMTERNTTPYQS